MRRASLLSMIWVLAACQAPLPNDGRPPVAPRSTRAPATLTPSSKPSATPTPTLEATPTPAVTSTPSVPMRLLSGLVKIDANYIISTGGGNIISTGGGNIISTGGGNIIAAGGGNIISTGGGNIISTGGGNIISTGGGNIITTGGGNFRTLLDTITVPIGTMLPVQGMAVAPISLLTGEPLGSVVLTDEKGEYQLPVPEAVADNVLIFSAVPAKDEESARKLDPRLRYGLLVDPRDATRAVIDEDSALVTRYILTIFVGRLHEFLTVPADDFEAFLTADVFGPDQLRDVPAFIRDGLIKSVRFIRGEADAVGVPMTERKQLAHRLADAIVARVNLDSILLDTTYYSGGKPGDEAKLEGQGALEVMQRILEQLRTRTAEKMAVNHDFDATSYLQKANILQEQRGEAPYRIARPSDFGQFYIREYLATSRASDPTFDVPEREVLRDIGMEFTPDTDLRVGGVLRAVQLSTLVQLALKFTNHDDPEIKRIIHAFE